MIAHMRFVLDSETVSTERLEYLVGTRKIRFVIFNYAAKIFENVFLGFGHTTVFGVNRTTAKVLAPGNSRAFEISFKRIGEL